MQIVSLGNNMHEMSNLFSGKKKNQKNNSTCLLLKWLLPVLRLFQHYLTFTTLWAFSADDKMMLFFLYFPENRIWHFMQIVSLGDNLHEMSNPVFWEK